MNKNKLFQLKLTLVLVLVENMGQTTTQVHLQFINYGCLRIECSTRRQFIVTFHNIKQ